MDEFDKQYPEHAKLKQVHEETQWLGEFLDWLGRQGIILAVYTDRDYLVPAPARNNGIQSILAEYKNIDLRKIDSEKKTMLEQMKSLTSSD